MFKGLFDVQSRFAKLDKNGDPLLKINQLINWNLFLPELKALRSKERKSNAGRIPYDAVLMFKMLVLQSLYNLSDDSLEQQVLDRLSFMRFLDLRIGDDVPDAKTVWAFRESLKQNGLTEKLFARFNDFLNQQGFTAQRGQIVDATIVKVPVRRDTREVNEKVKNGEDVSEWNPATRSQKDTCARWTKKNGKSFFGYKDHNCVDVEHKLIRSYEVTPASVHDSQAFEPLLVPNSDPSVYADSAYYSEDSLKRLSDAGWLPCLQEKGYAKHPLTEAQTKANRTRSKIRSRVEHVFGIKLQRCGNVILRTIGIARAKVKLGLRNLAYNITRYAFLANPGSIVG